MNKIIISTLTCVVIVLSLILNYQSISEFVSKLHIGRGEALLDQGQYEKAMEEFDKAIDNMHTMTFAYSDRADALYLMGRYDEAIIDCNKVIALETKEYYPYFIKANIYLKTSQLDKALKEINLAMARKSVFADIYTTRAMIYYRMNQYYMVLEDCDQAISLDPNQSIAFRIRGCVHAKAGMINISEANKAIADFSSAILINPKDADAYYNRGSIYMQQGDNTQAVADFEKTLNLTSDPNLLEMVKQQMENSGL